MAAQHGLCPDAFAELFSFAKIVDGTFLGLSLN